MTTLERLRERLKRDVKPCVSECKSGECDYHDLLSLINDFEEGRWEVCDVTRSPPFYRYEIGQTVKGTPLLIDERGEIPICHVQANSEVPCIDAKGAGVTVRPGEIFAVHDPGMVLSEVLGHEMEFGCVYTTNGRWR